MRGRTFRLKIDRPNAAEFLGHWNADRPAMMPTPYNKGDLVKVVMVSRMGDCGITTDLKKENGYATRVLPADLDPVEPLPDGVCALCNRERVAHQEIGCV
jgi:hypothetical protein